ncbi:uncharacterized protein LOC122230249 [Panthera leo]|uniref:uncharacterized protein LOC122230249 n=1 Tax=Panthera leo TaxID=9689 RepID=UPI001C69D943|nr:uncharacterized protein LOC122230249 [Panthera leo]
MGGSSCVHTHRRQSHSHSQNHSQGRHSSYCRSSTRCQQLKVPLMVGTSVLNPNATVFQGFYVSSVMARANRAQPQQPTPCVEATTETLMEAAAMEAVAMEAVAMEAAAMEAVAMEAVATEAVAMEAAAMEAAAMEAWAVAMAPGMAVASADWAVATAPAMAVAMDIAPTLSMAVALAAATSNEGTVGDSHPLHLDVGFTNSEPHTF